MVALRLYKLAPTIATMLWYGLASAIQKMEVDIPKLVNKNYQKFTSQYEVDDYIRSLRRALIDLKLQNDFLLKTEQYIPISCERNYPFDEDKMTVDQLDEPNRDYIAINVTFDHKKFPQLIITPLEEQKKYIKKVFSNLLYDNHITAVYGCFEKQKNGTIHGHFIAPHYGNFDNLEEHINTYFTNRTKQQQRYAVLIKPVTDKGNWFVYMNKDEPAPPYCVRRKERGDFIEWNLRKKTLDL